MKNVLLWSIAILGLIIIPIIVWFGTMAFVFIIVPLALGFLFK